MMIIVPAIVVLIVTPEAVDAMSAAEDERSATALIRTPDDSISIRNV